MPKISVLMPVFNAENYLKSAIDSIIAQTFTNWELVIVNDGSTDGSEKIIKSYNDKRILYVENERNIALIKTLNKGIDFCRGEYIARMDADDVAHPKRFAKQVDFLDNNPKYILCGTNASVIDKEGKVTGKVKNLTSNDFLQIHLLFSNPFIHPSIMIRNGMLYANRFDEHYKHVEDYELWVRLSKLGLMANINEDLLSYRCHDRNVSVLNTDIQNELKTQIIVEQLQNLDITPTEKEIYCHIITFKMYALGQKLKVSMTDFEAVEQWFLKLIAQNKKLKRYNRTDFVAYLWSRWVVLCISQRRYSKMFSPKFASFNPKVSVKLSSLILHLKNK